MGTYILLIFMNVYGGGNVTAVEMSGKVACEAAQEEIKKAHGSGFFSDTKGTLCIAKSAQVPKGN